MTKMKLRRGDRATFGKGGQKISGRVFAVVGRHYLVSADCGVVCSAYSDGMFRFDDDDLVAEADAKGAGQTVLTPESATSVGTFSL